MGFNSGFKGLNMKFDFVPDLCYVTLRHNNSAGMQYQIMRKKQLCCYRTTERFGEKKGQFIAIIMSYCG